MARFMVPWHVSWNLRDRRGALSATCTRQGRHFSLLPKLEGTATAPFAELLVIPCVPNRVKIYFETSNRTKFKLLKLNEDIYTPINMITSFILDMQKTYRFIQLKIYIPLLGTNISSEYSVEMKSIWQKIIYQKICFREKLPIANKEPKEDDV